MDDELCAMLAHYMPKEEMVRQYQEIFPEGHETYYQEQTPFDFSQIVAAISQSSDDDVQKALSLELPNQYSTLGTVLSNLGRISLNAHPKKRCLTHNISLKHLSFMIANLISGVGTNEIYFGGRS